MEKTLVIIKPDAVKRGLIGTIIEMYEKKGLKITAMKLQNATDEILDLHYQEHIGKPFYESLTTFMKSGPLVVMVIEGDEAVEKVRKINGATNPIKAEFGTIRALYAESTTYNCVHGSDSIENGLKECAIWFN